MKNKKTRRGFTIVELVIVVAVIGVLAAILIPTFVNLTSKANKAADDSLVSNLNTALAMAEVDDAQYHGKPVSSHNDTMQDAIIDLEYEGYHLENLTTRTNLNLLWNKETNRFLLDDTKSMNEQKNKETKEDFWKIVKNVGEMGEYSGYAHTNFDLGTGENQGKISVTAGFDVGYNTGIKEINFVTDEEKDVVIRTTSVLTDLKINAANATVHHYGETGKVDITAIDMDCYNEYGDSVYVKVIEGTVVAKDGGKINIVFADNTNGNVVAVLKETNGTINVGYTRVEDVDTANQARENGIELKYEIYLDETTTMDGDTFVNYVESSADYAVSTAKQVEEVAQEEKHNGPTGSFIVNDPFNSDYATMGDLVIELGRSIRGTDGSFGFDPFTEMGDPYLFNNNYEDLAEAIWDACDESEEDEPELTYTSTDLIEAEVDDMFDINIRALKVGSQDITFYVDGEEIGTIKIAVIVVGDYSSELEDGQGVFEIDGVSKNVSVDSNSHAVVDVSEFENGKTIKMLRSFNGQLDFKGHNNKSLVLDLNGFAIKTLKIDSITMTVIDSSESKKGKVEDLFFGCDYGVQNPNYPWDSFRDDVEVNSCVDGEYLYLDVWFERPAKLTLLGGSIKTLHLQYCGEVEIAGAQIINTDEQNDTLGEGYALSYVGSKYLNIAIKSGVMIGYKNFAYFGKATISGGYFSEEVPSQYLASGCTCVQIANGIYQVVSAD